MMGARVVEWIRVATLKDATNEAMRTGWEC